MSSFLHLWKTALPGKVFLVAIFWSFGTWVHHAMPLFLSGLLRSPLLIFKEPLCRMSTLPCCFNTLFSPVIFDRLITCYWVPVLTFILLRIYQAWICLFFLHRSLSSPYGVSLMCLLDHSLVSQESLRLHPFPRISLLLSVENLENVSLRGWILSSASSSL